MFGITPFALTVTSYTMTQMITDSGLWFAQFIKWAGDVGAMVVGSPLMLSGCVIGFGFAGISMFKSFAHR